MGIQKKWFRFQWGHNLAVMDTILTEDLIESPRELFQWGHNLAVMDTV